MSKNRRSLNTLLLEVMTYGVLTNVSAEEIMERANKYPEDPYSAEMIKVDHDMAEQGFILMKFTPFDTENYETIEQYTKNIADFCRLILINSLGR